MPKIAYDNQQDYLTSSVPPRESETTAYKR
jgi:hypothetical protein